jgi:hypothetical protein
MNAKMKRERFSGVSWRKVSRRNRMAGMRRPAISIAMGLLLLNGVHRQELSAQVIESPENAHPQVCPNPPPQTSGSHGFRREGETINIPINVADCQPVAFVLRWSNGRSHGSSLVVTFLDDTNQPIYSRSLSGFLTGSFEFPFASLDQQPWFARGSVVAVPTTIVIQALAPFAPPANISYTVIRKAAPASSRSQTEVKPVTVSISRPVSARTSLLDNQVAMNLRTADGRLLSEGQGSGFAESIRYKLKEVALREPKGMEIHGRREQVEIAYRLTLAGAKSETAKPRGTGQIPALSQFGLIWLDDAPFPAFSLDSQEISTLIYDSSVLKDGAEVSVSSVDGSNMYSLVKLKHQPKQPASTGRTDYEARAPSSSSIAGSSNEWEEGNKVVSIRSVVRVIGTTRMPLVQIELKTNRPFPPRDSALKLQIGKRFFLDELTGDHTGRTLVLTLTQDMFGELKQGAEIVAFFGNPDRSGFAGRDVWHFGRLDKAVR